MKTRPITRRAALSLLTMAPFIGRVAAEARPRSERRIHQGHSHTLLLEPDGTLKAWSQNIGRSSPEADDSLGLGHNDPVEIYTAYAVPGLKGVVAAAAGQDCSFAVLADGRVMAWGKHGPGVCGITPLSFLEERADPRPDVNTPTAVVVPFDAADISVYATHVLARTRDGGVYAWGEGSNGQLGIGPLPVITFRTNRPSAMSYVPFPVRVPDLKGVTAISAGVDHSLALLEDGALYAWGGNKFGQLGDGTTIDRNRPVPVQGIRNAVSIVASDLFSAAALADGTVMAWGSNIEGAVGPPWGGEEAPHPTPALVPGVGNVRTVAAGVAHVLALTRAGTLIAWGWNAHGQLGRGRLSGNPGQPPKAVVGLANVHAAFARGENGYAVLDDGRIAVWGWVPEFNRPDGRSSLTPSPILLRIAGLENP